MTLEERDLIISRCIAMGMTATEDPWTAASEHLRAYVYTDCIEVKAYVEGLDGPTFTLCDSTLAGALTQARDRLLELRGAIDATLRATTEVTP